VDSSPRGEAGAEAQISNALRAHGSGGHGDIQDAYIVNALTSHPGGPDANDQYVVQRPRGKNAGNAHEIAPTLTGRSYQDNNHVVTAIALRGREGGSQIEERSDGVANTVRTPTGGGSMGMIASGPRIRRLTPVECERLQGFPDNWTAGVSDTQRYKQMGNAVTVNVIEAIAKHLPLAA
jgi:DNA (cytosine-5)-methyltransferase 1